MLDGVIVDGMCKLSRGGHVVGERRGVMRGVELILPLTLPLTLPLILALVSTLCVGGWSWKRVDSDMRESICDVE